MNREQFEGSWRGLKGKIRQKWNKLTDEDINQINGKFDIFASKLHKRYGFTREQVEKELNNWKMEMGGAWGHETEVQNWGHDKSESKDWQKKGEDKQDMKRHQGEDKQDWKKHHGDDKKRKAG